MPFDDLNKGKSVQIFMKENTPVKVMCAMYGCPHMIDFANYVDQLRMDQEPDYDYLKFLLKKNLLDKDIVPW